MGLAVHDHRIDAAAHVVDRRIAHDVDRAGVGIDLDLADGAAVREDGLVHFIVGDDGEAVLEIVRQVDAARPRARARADRTAVGCRRGEAAVVQSISSRRVPRMARRWPWPLSISCRTPRFDHRRRMAHGAARMGAAADLHDVGVADDDVDDVDGQAEQIGRDLREARLVALPARLRADHDVTRPSGLTMISAPAPSASRWRIRHNARGRSRAAGRAWRSRACVSGSPSSRRFPATGRVRAVVAAVVGRADGVRVRATPWA